MMHVYEVEIINHTAGEESYYTIEAWTKSDAARYAILAHDGYSNWDIENDDIVATVW